MEDELNKISSLNRMSPRLVIQQLISFGLVVVTALMILENIDDCLSGSESRIVVVLSQPLNLVVFSFTSEAWVGSAHTVPLSIHCPSTCTQLDV